MSESDTEKAGAVVDPEQEINLLKWRKTGDMEDTKRRAWRAVRAAERALYASESRADVLEGARAVSSAVQTYRRLLKDEREAEREDAATVTLSQLAAFQLDVSARVKAVFQAHGIPRDVQREVAESLIGEESPAAQIAHASESE